jgi:hypothetical protein
MMRWRNELISAALVWLWWSVATERVPCSTEESRGRRMVAQNGKTMSGSGTHRRGGRGSGGSKFAEEPVNAVVFDSERGRDVTRVERGGGLMHGRMGVKRGRRGKKVTTALGGLYARAKRRREKNGDPGSVRVQVEENRGGGVRCGGRLAT